MRRWLAAGCAVAWLACGSSKEQKVLDKRDAPAQPGAEESPSDDGLATVAGGKIRIPRRLLDQLRATESPDLPVHAVKLKVVDGSPTLDFLSATPPQLVEDADKGITQVKLTLGEGAAAECTLLNGRPRLASWLAAGVGGVVSKAAAIKESHPVVLTHKGGAIPAVGVQIHYLTHDKLYGRFQVAVFHTGLAGVFCEMDQAAYLATFDRMVTTLANSAARESGPSAPRETHEISAEGVPAGIAYRFKGVSGTNTVSSNMEVGLLVRPEGLVGLDEGTVEETDSKGRLVKLTTAVHINHSPVHELVGMVSDKEIKLSGTFQGKPYSQTLPITQGMRSHADLADWRKQSLEGAARTPLTYQSLEVLKEGPMLMLCTTTMEDADKQTFLLTRESASKLRLSTDGKGRLVDVRPVAGRGWVYQRLTGGDVR